MTSVCLLDRVGAEPRDLVPEFPSGFQDRTPCASTVSIISGSSLASSQRSLTASSVEADQFSRPISTSLSSGGPGSLPVCPGEAEDGLPFPDEVAEQSCEVLVVQVFHRAPFKQTVNQTLQHPICGPSGVQAGRPRDASLLASLLTKQTPLRPTGYGYLWDYRKFSLNRSHSRG